MHHQPAPPHTRACTTNLLHHTHAHVQLDEFRLDLGALDLGELLKVDIGFATKQTVAGMIGGLGAKAWNLTSVEVRWSCPLLSAC